MPNGPRVLGPVCPWPLCCLQLPNVPCSNVRKLGQMCACQHCVIFRQTKVMK